MALGSGLGPVVAMAPGGRTGHPDQNDPGSTMALGHQDGLGWLARPLVVMGAMDVNLDPGCCRVTHPDMAHSSNLGLDDMTEVRWKGQHRALRSVWLWWCQGPWTRTRPQVMV